MSDNENPDAPQSAEPEPQTIEPENQGDQPDPQVIDLEHIEGAYAGDVFEDEEDDKGTGPILDRPKHDDDPDEDLDDDIFEDIN